MHATSLYHPFLHDKIANYYLHDCPQDVALPSYKPGDPKAHVEQQKTFLLHPKERLLRSNALRIFSNAQKNAFLGVFGKRKIKAFKVSKKQALINTYTKVGKVYLLSISQERFCYLKGIGKKEGIFKAKPSKKILDSLALLKLYEKDLISFWDDRIQMPPSVGYQYIRFNHRFDSLINTNLLALEFNSSLEKFKALTTIVTKVASAVFMPLYALSLWQGGQVSYFFKDYTTRFMGTAGPIYSAALLMPSPFIQGITALAAGCFAAFNIEGKVDWFKADLELESIVQNKLVNVASLYRGMKSLYEELKEVKKVDTYLFYFSILESFFENKDLKELFDLLESKTFDSYAHLFFSRGKMLLLWRLLQEKNVQIEFEKALMAVAEIDAAFSLNR